MIYCKKKYYIVGSGPTTTHPIFWELEADYIQMTDGILSLWTGASTTWMDDLVMAFAPGEWLRVYPEEDPPK